jgi:threonine/homoserine/homoserine lactone efflux protein
MPCLSALAFGWKKLCRKDEVMADLWMFIGALAVIYLVPGPDMALILQTGALQGRRDALATVVGFACARAGHVALAALGLAALLKTSPWAFDIVRLIGTGYLIWIGVGLCRAGILTVSGVMPARGCGRRRSVFHAARRGLVTNISNPKALLFCSILLPQFIHRDAGNVPMQFILLGAVLVMIGIGFDLVYAGLGSAVGTWTRRHPWFARLQSWAFGALMIGFGIRLLTASRPQ